MCVCWVDAYWSVFQVILHLHIVKETRLSFLLIPSCSLSDAYPLYPANVCVVAANVNLKKEMVLLVCVCTCSIGANWSTLLSYTHRLGGKGQLIDHFLLT